MVDPIGSRVLRLAAPAKVNLHLRVGPKAADGFHPVLTWMCTVGLFDTLVLELDPRDVADDGTDGIRLSCDDPALPCDSRNLVRRAAEALARSSASGHGETPLPTRSASAASPQTSAGGAGSSAAHEPVVRAPAAVVMNLSKRIPAGAGLGGGSSDAAAALVGLNRLWNLNYTTDRLSTIAATLGSDVPFFLYGPSSVCTGRGERVQPVAPPSPKWCLLVLPDMSLPTPAVYKRFDDLRLGSERDVELQPAWRGWSDLSADQLLPRLANDLEPAAFAIEPRLGQLRGEIESLLARPIRMSGSGSSLFTLFDDATSADRAAERVTRQLGVRALAVTLAPRFEDDVQQARE